MKHGVYPYRGVSSGITDFGDSMCVASVYPSTRIGDILHRFSVSGVLPQVGRAAIPADLVCGGEDFNSLRNKIDDLRSQGITMEQIEEMLNGEVSGNVDSDDSKHGSEGSLESPADESGKAGVVPTGDQGASPATV